MSDAKRDAKRAEWEARLVVLVDDFQFIDTASGDDKNMRHALGIALAIMVNPTKKCPKCDSWEPICACKP